MVLVDPEPITATCGIGQRAIRVNNSGTGSSVHFRIVHGLTMPGSALYFAENDRYS